MEHCKAKGKEKLTMTRDEMIRFILDYPNVKITHHLFSGDEYIYRKQNGQSIWDENNYLFEDWVSKGPGQHNGIRMRIGGNWEDGWSVADL